MLDLPAGFEPASRSYKARALPVELREPGALRLGRLWFVRLVLPALEFRVFQPVAALAPRAGDGVAVGQPQAGGAFRRLARISVASDAMTDGGYRPGVRRRFVRGGGNVSGRRLRVVSGYCSRLPAGHGPLDSVRACRYGKGRMVFSLLWWAVYLAVLAVAWLGTPGGYWPATRR